MRCSFKTKSSIPWHEVAIVWEEYLEQQCPLQPSSTIPRHDLHLFFKQKKNQLLRPLHVGLSTKNCHILCGLDKQFGWSLLFPGEVSKTRDSTAGEKKKHDSILQGIVVFRQLCMGISFLLSKSIRALFILCLNKSLQKTCIVLKFVSIYLGGFVMHRLWWLPEKILPNMDCLLQKHQETSPVQIKPKNDAMG